MDACEIGLLSRTKLVLILIVLESCIVHWASCVTIGITHFNDIRGQVESFERGSFTLETPTPCGNRAETVFNCTGGLRSIAHWLNDSSVYEGIVFPGNIIRLSSGNLVGGESGWISPSDGGWSKFGELVDKHFRPHVISLGLKEFEGGLAATLDFLRMLSPGSVTLANACAYNDSAQIGPVEREFCEAYQIHEKIKVITILDVEKYTEIKIGVIGFVSPLVERLAIPGKLKFTPVIPALKQVIDRNSDIKSFIAIGDGSQATGQEILEMIPQVQLVLYGAAHGSNNHNGNAYPIQFKHGYLATAGQFGSSIGNLIFDVDATTGQFHLVENRSKLVETVRPPIWNSAAQAAQIDYTRLEAQVRSLKASTLGFTRARLQGGKMCWRQECNLGNLVADALVHCALEWASLRNKKPFEFPVHSVYHAGALFLGEISARSRISMFDVNKWLPYHNRAHLVKLSGRNMKRLLDASGSALVSSSEEGNVGQFLQVSNGLEVYFKSGKAAGIKLTRDFDGIPRLSEILEEAEYYFVVPTFIYQARGEFGFAEEAGFWRDVVFDNMTKSADFAADTDCLAGFVKALGQVSVGFEKRIWTDLDPNGRLECSQTSTMLIVLVTVLVFGTLQGSSYIVYLKLFPFLRQRFPLRGGGSYPPNQL